MKKIYITPALHVEHIHVEMPLAASPATTTMAKDPSKTIGNSADILSKDRGDYIPEDDATFGNLW